MIRDLKAVARIVGFSVWLVLMVVFAVLAFTAMAAGPIVLVLWTVQKLFF